MFAVHGSLTSLSDLLHYEVHDTVYVRIYLSVAVSDSGQEHPGGL